MEPDFRVSVQRNNGSLYMKFFGDFNKISAGKVLQVLKDSCDGVSKIYINTSGLNHIHPFGLVERQWTVWEKFLNVA